MTTVIADKNQTIWDLALQIYGAAEGVKQLILDNPETLNFNDDVVEGSVIKVNENAIINSNVVAYFKKRGIKPVTFSGINYEPELLTWMSYFSVIPDEDHLLALNELIIDLKAANYWQEFDRLWIFANPTKQQALTDLVGGYVATEAAPMNFSPFQGFQNGIGGVGYINTNFTPYTDSVKFSQNSACVGVYSLTNDFTDGIDFGCQDNANYDPVTMNVLPQYSTILAANYQGTCASINSEFYEYTGVVSADTLGLRSIFRNSNGTMTYYNRGVIEWNAGFTTAPLAHQPFYVCAANMDGIPDLFSIRKIAIAYIGSGVIDPSVLNTIFQNFATKAGFNV